MATIAHIKTIENSSVNVPPAWCQVGKEKVCCYSRRPVGGGPVCVIEWVTGDGREVIPALDVRPQLPDFEDSALATPFVSEFSGTLKAFLIYKRAGGGNDRELAIIDTGLVPEVTRL